MLQPMLFISGWMDWKSLGGRKYRAAYAANNCLGDWRNENNLFAHKSKIKSLFIRLKSLGNGLQWKAVSLGILLEEGRGNM